MNLAHYLGVPHLTFPAPTQRIPQSTTFSRTNLRINHARFVLLGHVSHLLWLTANLLWGVTMRPEMIEQITRKQFFCAKVGSGQEVCFGPSRPDPGRKPREQDGTRTGRDGPHLGTWMGPKYCKTKHMANLDGTPLGPGRAQDRTEARIWMAPPEAVTDF